MSDTSKNTIQVFLKGDLIVFIDMLTKHMAESIYPHMHSMIG